MASEDITFCMSDCNNMKCFRNKKHIKYPEFPHSFAFLENTKDCMKVVKMRSPKVKNKYNLTMKKINKLKVGDESKIKEPLFWRNNVINAWCINRIIGTDDDVKYGTDNHIWIGIYDKPYYNRRIHVRCSCYGGMCFYKFDKFFRYEDIEYENDFKTQEELLRTVNMLIDEGILVIKDGRNS